MKDEYFHQIDPLIRIVLRRTKLDDDREFVRLSAEVRYNEGEKWQPFVLAGEEHGATVPAAAFLDIAKQALADAEPEFGIANVAAKIAREVEAAIPPTRDATESRPPGHSASQEASSSAAPSHPRNPLRAL